MRTVAVGAVVVALAGCAASDRADESEGSLGALTLPGVTFRTSQQGRFLGAQNNGGGAVTATATTAQAWETFSLEDLNGGALQSGDAVGVRTGGGLYLQATNGGGSTLDAAGTRAAGNAVFRLSKASGGAIHSGDVVGLQAINGNWVSAENGGGGAVFAFGGSLSAWEQLVIGLGGSAPPPPPPSSDWRLVWSDEFNGNRVDTSNWSYEVQGPGWVNHELQNYTRARAENARVENGHLVIEARRDGFGGEYSSARLKTQGHASWTFGRIEARMQLPGGRGTWPAFWMIADNQSRGWPACGEIDIMEEVGFDPNSIHASTHSAKFNWTRPEQRTTATSVGGVTSDFHVYAIEWFSDRIDFFVDGRKYFTSGNDRSGDDAYPFTKNFHIILNLAVGGDWGGSQGVDPNIWPRQLLVDYVRVYQR